MQYVTHYHSPIGIVEIKGDDHSVSSIMFTETPIAAQKEELPSMMLQAQKEIEEYFEAGRRAFTFSFQQEGTNFQQKVWEELQSIPHGKTASYLQLARAIGDEKLVRAVGSANGKNKIWIVVPCHRVIGSGSQLVGYAGGLWRKQWLLEHENQSAGKTLSLFN